MHKINSVVFKKNVFLHKYLKWISYGNITI